ncbi:protein-cysteine N-palmitoyltransferase HHAT isoform X2 [Bombina bombina]|uniref:protein-cysteine N-palmitoyltransferase HHAT isoform X2 n=1 Tax=Bombina bombina TaxID=8345 RepID=UPI00235B1C43|nr:protein-cysteine N-palmitoyltransferase HHAT isoform X2 [Bombina bombina]
MRLPQHQNKHRPWFLMVYGILACWTALGTNGLTIIFLNICISYIVAMLKSPWITWLSSMLMLLMLHENSVENVQRGWYINENEYYLLLFTLTVRCLYYTSFSLEYSYHQISENVSYSFTSMLVYVFYYPVFHNGPIITFNEFSKQMDKQDLGWSKHSICALTFDIVRLFIWWWLAESMLHLMYIHAIYSSYSLLEQVSYWALGGLALAQVLFFYVKYLVLYGLPALIIRLDGLNPPALPRCVSTMFSFTGIWRSFDVGLHRFLVRYIYIPLGGSQRGLWGMLFSTALTFTFVCFWHGGHGYLWYWAAMNWIGIITEQGIKKMLSTSYIQSRIGQTLSPNMYRRVQAAVSSISTALLILTNIIFLGGEEVGKIYWRRLFVHGWPWVPLTVFICLYFFAQIGIEWDTFYFRQYKGGFPRCSLSKLVK